MTTIKNINTKKPGDCGFVAGFRGREVGIYAPSLMDAKHHAVIHFHATSKKAYSDLWVVLAERSDGTTVLQSTTEY